MSDFPTYENPPVIETILGVQFEPLEKMRIGHLGLFWGQLGDDWPQEDDAPSLEPQFEEFTDKQKFVRMSLGLRVSQMPECRIRVRNCLRDRMIQVQNGRFIVNWLRVKDAEYPRYETLRTEFDRYFSNFCEFVKAKDLGEVSLNQWETTYLNHIPRGTLWESPMDWGFFRPIGEPAHVDGLAELEDLSGEVHYRIPERRGRVHVSWQYGKTGESKEVLVVNLTARGPIPDEGALNGLDIGREATVKIFRRIMSDEANKYWGIKNAGI